MKHLLPASRSYRLPNKILFWCPHMSQGGLMLCKVVFIFSIWGFHIDTCIRVDISTMLKFILSQTTFIWGLKQWDLTVLETKINFLWSRNTATWIHLQLLYYPSILSRRLGIKWLRNWPLIGKLITRGPSRAALCIDKHSWTSYVLCLVSLFGCISWSFQPDEDIFSS